jgi:hypothetical protein
MLILFSIFLIKLKSVWLIEKQNVRLFGTEWVKGRPPPTLDPRKHIQFTFLYQTLLIPTSPPWMSSMKSMDHGSSLISLDFVKHLKRCFINTSFVKLRKITHPCHYTHKKMVRFFLRSRARASIVSVEEHHRRAELPPAPSHAPHHLRGIRAEQHQASPRRHGTRCTPSHECRHTPPPSRCGSRVPPSASRAHAIARLAVNATRNMPNHA